MSGARPDPRAFAIAILCTIAAGTLLASMDATGKWLNATVPVLQIIWARYFFHAAATAVWLGKGGDFSFVRSKRPWLQFLRAGCLFGVTACLYTALTEIPLANGTALQFFAPVMVTVFSGLILGEHIGWRRASAVVVGFIGVLIITRPGFQAIDLPTVLAFLSSVFYALYMVLTRLLHHHDDERTTLFYATGVGAVLLTLALPFVWRMPEGGEWGLLVVLGLLGASGHFLLVRAFHLVPAAMLSPFLYSQLLAATVISVVVFGDIPDWPLLVGATITVGSGLYIWYRERQQHKREASFEPPLPTD